MKDVFRSGAFRHLFAAQVVALLGTGLLTVALALLAFDIAGGDAGTVLGTALAIKMVVYVIVAPVSSALLSHVPRRSLLISLDLVRVGVALMLPFVTEVWQVYVLIFLLQTASAAFTPTFQATIPDILTDEKTYTKALSLSRLAYDLENLISPLLAGALLSVVAFNHLFVGTAVGFLISAALVVSTSLPATTAVREHGIRERLTRGIRFYMATPRLRGLLAINLAVAAAGAMVIINTVVIVQGKFGLTARETAFAFAAFGGGSMIVALVLPRLLDRLSDRKVMLAGAVLLTLGAAVSGSLPSLSFVAVVWFFLGCGTSLAMTPSGRLLRRSVHAEDRPAIYAAQFALSHACWLAAYPLAGWLGSILGLVTTAVILAVLATIGTVTAFFVWPATDTDIVEHSHADLPPDHPHLQSGEPRTGHRHAHPYVIDDLHLMWPQAR
jgi:MFS family permease